MCEANQGASSLCWPERIFKTPFGRSLVATTSAKLIAESGDVLEAKATVVFPETKIGATAATKPRSGLSIGVITPTTPSASGIVKL
jgi:hypothetical protein